MKSTGAPALAVWVARRLIPHSYRDAFLGDLAEEFHTRMRRYGRRPASRWYWKQILSVDVWRLRRLARRASTPRPDGGGGMSDLWRVEVRQAVRIVRRSPGFAAAVVLTLAVGIGGVTAIFHVANAALVHPVPAVERIDRLAAIWTRESGSSPGVSSYMDFLDFVERSRSFDRLAVFKPQMVDVSTAAGAERVTASMVTSGYFAVLGVTPLLGRLFEPSVDQGVGSHPLAILTYGGWQRRFGADSTVVGKDVVLNGLAYTVIGVTPPGFRGTTLMSVPDLFVPMTMQPHLMPTAGNLLGRRGWGGVFIIGRLRPDATLAGAEADIGLIGEQLATEHPRTNTDRTYQVAGLREAALPASVRGGFVQMIGLLFASTLAVWLVVCINVANLSLARSLRRRQEMGVRRALGAGRARLTGQLMLESMVLASGGAVAGLVLARWLVATLANLPLGLTLTTALNVPTVVFAGVVGILSGIVCAVAPSVTLAGADPVTAIRSSHRSAPLRQRWPSRVLIISQVTLSLMLVAGTGLFVQTYAHLATADLGFDPRNILAATLDPSLQGYDTETIRNYYGQIHRDMSATPGVADVTFASVLPGPDTDVNSTFLRGGERPEEPLYLQYVTVGTNFFPMMGIPIVAGRAFTESDTGDRPPVFIVNEAAAARIEARTGRPALGESLSLRGPAGPFFQIVGIAANSRTGTVRDGSVPLMYYAQPQGLAFGFGSRMVMLVRTVGNPAAMAPELRRVAREVDPNVSASGITTMDAHLASALIADRIMTMVLAASAVIALLLVALGLYALLAYMVAQRAREFGIRVALGATGSGLKVMVVREGLILTGVGLVLGVAGAVAVVRLATVFLYGVSPFDPLALSGAVTVVLGVTLGASYLPARRAMRTDPVVALRSE